MCVGVVWSGGENLVEGGGGGVWVIVCEEDVVEVVMCFVVLWVVGEMCFEGEIGRAHV